MAYTQLDASKPTTAQTRQALTDSTRNNLAALRDNILAGFITDWDVAVTGGTSDKPTTITYTNLNNTNEKVRETLTWSSNRLTQRVVEYTANNGGLWDTVDTLTYTYDGSDNATGGNAGGFFHWIARIYARLLNAISTLTTHVAGTGTAVHGLGTLSTQNSNNISATGGSIDGVAVDTPRTREVWSNLGSIANGGTATCDLNAASGFSLQPSATTSHTLTIAFSNPPASGKVQSWYIEIINGRRDIDARITWPANVKWIGGSGSRPTDPSLELSGRNIFAVYTRDGGSRYEIQHIGKGG